MICHDYLPTVNQGFGKPSKFFMLANDYMYTKSAEQTLGIQSPSETGSMEPQYYSEEVIGHPLLIIWEYDDGFLGINGTVIFSHIYRKKKKNIHVAKYISPMDG